MINKPIIPSKDDGEGNNNGYSGNSNIDYSNTSGSGSGTGSGSTRGSGTGSGSGSTRGSGSGSGSTRGSGSTSTRGSGSTSSRGTSTGERRPSTDVTSRGSGSSSSSYSLIDDGFLSGILNNDPKTLNHPDYLYGNNSNPIYDVLEYLKGQTGDRDSRFSYGELLLQYLLNEQNFQRNQDNSELAFQRSTAANQVALMMAAGMSRAAALKAIQSGGAYTPLVSDGQISPLQTNTEDNRTNRINSLLSAAQTAAQLANQINALVQLPFDIKSKQITNSILTNQNDMLAMQIQGMQDAAAFMQAVSNHDSSSATKISDMSFDEQYAYFQKQSKMSPADSGFNPSAFFFGNSQPFARSCQNPFFWATLNETKRNKNFADASAFEPERAQMLISQIRAGIGYTQSLTANEKFRSTILGNQAFIDECSVQARKDLEMCKLACEKYGYQFDGARAQQFLSMLSQFGKLDALNLDYNINRITNINDPTLFDKEKDALSSSFDYACANYLYGSSLASLKQGVLSSMMQDDLPNEELNSWINAYLKFSEFGYGNKLSSYSNIWRTAFSGVSTAALSTFGALKIISGLKPAASSGMFSATATNVGNYGMSVAPIVAPVLPELFQPQSMQWSHSTMQ